MRYGQENVHIKIEYFLKINFVYFFYFCSIMFIFWLTLQRARRYFDRKKKTTYLEFKKIFNGSLYKVNELR